MRYWDKVCITQVTNLTKDYYKFMYYVNFHYLTVEIIQAV